ERALQCGYETRARRQGTQPDIFCLSIRFDVEMIRAFPSFGIARGKMRPTDFLQSAEERRGWFARAVFRDGFGQEPFDDFAVRCLGQDSRYCDGETARRGIESRLTRGGEKAITPDALDERASECLAQALERLRRKLFRT